MINRFSFIAATLVLMTRLGFSLTISSNVPGNILAADNPIEFSVAGAKDVVNYDLNDYYDAQIESGHVLVKDNATVMVSLPGLRPGWYKFRCEDGTGASATVPVGVVINRGNKSLPADGRLGADTIGGGAELVNLIRMAGIPWVRERLWWMLVQPAKETTDWTPFAPAARVLSDGGVQVLQVWYDSPPWTHPKDPTGSVPDDLRDVYRFSRAAAKEFAGKYQAWEMGNEPKSSWAGKADRFAGYEKAVYLGLKDGNPAAVALQAAVSSGVTPFLRNLYESGLANYADVFSWHFSGDPEEYAESLNAYRQFLKEFHADGRPLWTTQGAGPPVAAPGSGKAQMTPTEQREACRTTVRNAVMSLVAGNDRYFHFCLPGYRERGLQFGLLRGDQTPYPGFVAYSAAANILGLSEYLGEFKTPDDEVAAYVFATPKGNVLVAWSDQETEIKIPSENPEVRVADTFGDEREITVQNDRVRVKIGEDATYVINVGNAIKSELSGTPRPRGKVPAHKPSRTVLLGHCDLPVDTDRGCYRVDNATFDFTVEAYNFRDKDNVSGIVEIAVPQGWKVEPPQRNVTLGPMDRAIMAFKITPAPATTPPNVKVIVKGSFGSDKVAPSVSYFALAPATPTTMEHKPPR